MRGTGEGAGSGHLRLKLAIGCGKEFKGVYDRQNRKVIHFTSNTNARAATATEIEPDDPALADLIGQAKRNQLVDEIELLDGASCDFDLDRVRHGKLSPVFFGSALTNFGVEPFLEEFLRMTTAPLPRKAGDDVIRIPLTKTFRLCL